MGLLTDSETRKMEYERAKRQRNQSVPPNRHWTIIERIKEEKNQRLEWQKKSGNQLLLEVQALKSQLNRTRKKRNELERKRDDIVYRICARNNCGANHQYFGDCEYGSIQDSETHKQRRSRQDIEGFES